MSQWLSGLQLNPATVVNVWKSGDKPAAEMQKVTGAGYQAILSSCWYLNKISYGEHWTDYYNCDPQVRATDSLT